MHDGAVRDGAVRDGAVGEGGMHDGGELDGRAALHDASVEQTDAASFDAGTHADAATSPDASSLDSGMASEAGVDAGAVLGGDDATYPEPGPGHPIGVWGTALPCGRLGNLSVASGAIFDVGHAAQMASLYAGAKRVLSIDVNNHWVLWNASDHTFVAGGMSAGASSGRQSILAGGRFVIAPTSSIVQLRSAVTGHLIAAFASPLSAQTISPFGIAEDGSYVWIANTSGITAWNSTGDVIASATGDYSKAKTFAAAGELRIASGPGGSNVIQTISTVTGVSSNSPSFMGTFHSWFLDGSHFLTNVSTTVRAYSLGAVQQAIVALPNLDNLTGQGDAFWIHRRFSATGSPLDIYSLAAPNAPIKTYGIPGQAIAAGNSIGVILDGVDELSIIALNETDTPMTKHSVPAASLSAFTADTAGNWMFGTAHGALFENAHLEHPLSCGRPYQIAGSDTGLAAIATASGGVHVFDLAGASHQYLGTIPFNSSHIEMSTDGTVLAALANQEDYQYQDDRSLKVFAMPAATEAKVWAYSLSTAPFTFFEFSMSASGNRFGHVTGVYNGDWTYTRQVLAGPEAQPDFSETASNNAPLRLSPGGTRVAAATGALDSRPDYSMIAANVYENGTLISAVPGYPVAWLSEDRLLVNRYAASGLGGPKELGAEIYDALGNLQTTPVLPNFREVRVISPTAVYSNSHNAIFSLVTGDKIWQRPSSPLAASVAGDFVVLGEAETVNIEPR